MPFLNRFSNRLLLIQNYDHRIPLTYWVGTAPIISGHVAVSSSGNMYISGGSLESDAKIAKYNSSGVIQWQKNLGGAVEDASVATAVDSYENIYICGYTFNSGSNIRNILVAKYNSSGVIQWQKRIGGAVGIPDSGNSIAVDSSGNVYISGTTTVSGTSNIYTAKLSSLGAIIWQKSLGGASSETGGSVAVDSSGNVYVIGSTNDGSITGPLIAKYNIDNTIAWRRRLNTTIDTSSFGIAVDSSGNVYISYLARPTTGTISNDMGIAKYNSSGTIVWQRRIGSTADERPANITVDSSGKIYVIGYNVSDSGSPFLNVLIVKYETDGTVLWQRSIGGASPENGTSIVTDINGNIYICASLFNPGANTFFAKLPSDGTLTGTYDVNGYSIVYANTTFTNFTTTFASTSSSITNIDASLASSNAGLTSTSGTGSSYVTTIP